MFATLTPSDPELIVNLIMEAVDAPSPRPVYEAGTLSEAFLGKRAELSDQEFYHFMLDKFDLKGD
jgi:hypothetical protein